MNIFCGFLYIAYFYTSNRLYNCISNPIFNYFNTLQLQLFSLQILHRENSFTAKGLTVDATLLTAVSNQSFALIMYMYIIDFVILLIDSG